MSVSDVAKSGDRRALLEAVRDRLADALDMASPNVVAQIASQLAAVARELDELPAPSGVSVVDQLRSRRAERFAAAAVPDRAAGGSL